MLDVLPKIQRHDCLGFTAREQPPDQLPHVLVGIVQPPQEPQDFVAQPTRAKEAKAAVARMRARRFIEFRFKT